MNDKEMKKGTCDVEAASVEKSMLDAAKKYLLNYRWPVFPLSPNTKIPATRNGFKDGSIDPSKVNEWFTSNSAYNVGIPTGSKSSIVVIDLDEKNGVSGMASLQALEAENEPLPTTLRSNTGSGGQHIFFRYPRNTPVRNRTAILPGVDVRAEGGYIVAPPSKVDGKQYQWQQPDAPIAELPTWLLKVITSKKHAKKPVDGVSANDVASIARGSRNESLFRFVLGQMKSGQLRTQVEDNALHANLSMCNPPLLEPEVLQIVENVYRLYKNKPVRELTDIGNGKKMAELYAHEIRYLLETKDSWLQWTGTMWKRVTQTIVKGLSKHVPAAFAAEADALQQGPEKTALKKHALRSSSDGKLNATVELFKSEPGVGISISTLDKHDYIFPVENGLVDLRTGKFLPPDPALLITQVAGAKFDAESKCPKWDDFLCSVMGGDNSLVVYLQRAVGYALSGSLREQCLFFAYGFGANGKTTFLNVIRALFGDLGLQASSETLMETKRSSSGTSSDLARLRGKRFVAMSETDEGRHLNEGLVKSLTGGDPIIARDLYESIFEFNPTHKFFLASNHKPTIKGTDLGIWRRIRLIPFGVTISPDKRNPNLENELREELPGILNWAIQGCLDWQRDGLTTPQAIEIATNEYRSDMDIVGSWITDFCELGMANEMSFDDAYKSFDPWCKENYNFSFSKKRLGQMLVERGFEPINRNGRKYKGLTLKTSLQARVKNSLSENSEF